MTTVLYISLTRPKQVLKMNARTAVAARQTTSCANAVRDANVSNLVLQNVCCSVPAVLLQYSLRCRDRCLKQETRLITCWKAANDVTTRATDA